MAGPGRRRLDMPVRLFRLAVRDLRAAAAAPEPEGQVQNLGPPEEAMADTQERTVVKRRAGTVGAEAEASNKRIRLSADTLGLFMGKPTGAGEGTFSSSEELATDTSAGRPKSFKEVEKEVHQRRGNSIEEEDGQYDQKIKHNGTGGHIEIGNPNLLKQDSAKAKDDDELMSTDAAQKAKNDMATLDFLAELEAKFSLDIYRQRFALTNNLPVPPPSWDRLPTPPTPSSPPPIVQIGTYEQAKTALKAWNKGCHMHIQISEQLLLSDAEQVSEIVKDADADRVVLNPSILEAKVSQAKFLRQMISHTIGELQRYNNMLALPWMPTQTVSGCNLL